MRHRATRCVPTYNRCAFVREALVSVQAQTVSHWELLIVDDGSDDRTVELCQAVDDRRVRVVPIGHSGIVGHVRNEGARLAAGDCGRPPASLVASVNRRCARCRCAGSSR